MKYKNCTNCGELLPVTTNFFNSDKSKKDGFRGECKKCRKLKMKEFRENNKEKVSKIRHEFYINNKEKISEYNKVYHKENYNSKKEYYNNNSLNYYKKHKETILIKRKKYQQENRKKIYMYQKKRESKKRNLPNTLTLEQWDKTKAKFNNKCAYCGKEKALEQEHFIPLSKGGELTINNIIPSCKNCNCSKNNKNFSEWYSKYKYYSKEREKFILRYLDIQQTKNI